MYFRVESRLYITSASRRFKVYLFRTAILRKEVEIMLKRSHSTLRLFIIFALAVATGLPAYNAPVLANAPQLDSSDWTIAEPEGFVYYANDGEVICRPATVEEARTMNERDPDAPLWVITRKGLSPEAGDITITLRGTAQLNTFPLARDGFLAAANRWISRLQSVVAITIVIDVDFGPTRFGTPFPANVLGSTGTQALFNPSGYADVRNRLITGASAQEAALYNSLPASPLPTDIGGVAGVTVPSALLRNLGSINPVADPAGEQAQFGPPPSIGFNSNFAFDFNPDDGINPNQIDFDGVAAHEIGHALGFSSRVGNRELNPSASLDVSVLDIFRFRPGTTAGTFPTAQRILSSGGDHMFFDGGAELALSTGRPNGTGGDGEQSSHWKDSRFLGMSIGLMDPAIAFGERSAITDADLRAFDRFGYTLREGGGAAPAISSLVGNLFGDVLTLTGTVTDVQGDITQAQTTLLDESGNILRQDAAFAVNPGGQTTFNFNLEVNGLANVPAAMRCRLVFIDGQGNNSNAVTADFSEADSGGPTIKSASFSGSSITVKGKSFNGLVQLEINGVIVGTKDNSSKKKLKINGDQTALNLRGGLNRVRVRKNNLWSNIEVLNL